MKKICLKSVSSTCILSSEEKRVVVGGLSFNASCEELLRQCWEKLNANTDACAKCAPIEPELQ